MSDVFISYSRKDSDFAKKLTNTLVETGRDIWIELRYATPSAAPIRPAIAQVEAINAPWALSITATAEAEQ